MFTIQRICIALGMIAVILLSPACSGDGDSAWTPTTPDTESGGGSGDVIALSMDGAANESFVEASGLPNIDCDPRVDWGAKQVILWDQFTNGAGPNGYETFFEIMFPNNDAVGTYTVQLDFLQALLYANGENYVASPLFATSSGTVTVMRSDTRIEGSYTITLVDANEQNSVTVTGTFGVDAGFSLSCP